MGQSSVGCDEKLTPGWYRFFFPSKANGGYARIPSKPPAKEYKDPGQVCGTHGTAWMNETLPAVGEPPREVVMRFGWSGVDDRASFRVTGAKVVACKDHTAKTYFLYYLKPNKGCKIGFCALTG